MVVVTLVVVILVAVTSERFLYDFDYFWRQIYYCMGSVTL